MKKKKRGSGRSEEETSESLIGKRKDGADEVSDGGNKGFFACYLLASLSPRHKGQTYIGFTVNPRRRIRQHNGEIRCGAWRTKSKRPWEMVLCIYGFPTNVAALQFEWAWQHPRESLAVRKAAASFKTLSGVANKIKLAYTMLTLPAWQGLNLTVNFFSTKYTKHSGGCPSLPEHMKMQVCNMDDLPCYVEGNLKLWAQEDDVHWNDDEELETSGSTENNASDVFSSTTPYSSAENQKIQDNIITGDHRQIEDNSIIQLAGSSTFKDEDDSSGFNLSKESEESRYESACSAGPSSEVAAAHQQPTSCMISRKVEVIDVATPSPDCRISLCTRKRRASEACPQFIDLTRSPIFVQL